MFGHLDILVSMFGKHFFLRTAHSVAIYQIVICTAKVAVQRPNAN